MRTSLFDLFKIGLGPSSSHTVGPMRAAAAFARRLAASGRLVSTRRVAVDLYGSLALTGRGHGTDRAVMLGLEGRAPDRTEPEIAAERIEHIRATQSLALAGTHPLRFHEPTDIVFLRGETLARHANALRIRAFDDDGSIDEETYFSTGGGFIETASAPPSGDIAPLAPLPYPFNNAAELLALGNADGRAIWEMVLANECALRSEREVRRYVDRIWAVMQGCVTRGLATEGMLPGGLNVRRRAPRLYRKVVARDGADGLAAMDYVNAVAMAVNEENAAGSRVVTAPTNGAAGIIPAVAHYYERFTAGASPEGRLRYFLTAAAIGALYKENASISGAEVGCQGEVGVACSMAAGGLAAALGGSNAHVESAAEIGMEHSLGMTCDPIGGLVQIPCIERNAVGAVRAIHAARMAMEEDDQPHHVSLDMVIEVMYRTGLDMQTKYKETSLGGLAVGVVEC